MPRAKQSKRRSTMGTIWQHRDRWAAKYKRGGTWHTPGRVFATFKLADDWMLDEQRLIDRGEWTPPADRRAAAEAEAIRDATTLGDYARDYIDNRITSAGRPLSERTKKDYRRYLTSRAADLAALPLTTIDRARIEQWWADNADAVSERHHVYVFVKQVLADAVKRGMTDANPCQIANGSRRPRITPRSERDLLVTGLGPLDIQTLTDAMPPEWQAAVALIAWTGVRPGEVFALTRADISRATDADGIPQWTLTITKAVSVGKDGKGRAAGATKTDESRRRIPIPPHMVPLLANHLKHHSAPGEHGLIFPSSHPGMAFATTQQLLGSPPTPQIVRGHQRGSREGRGFAAARLAIGRPTLRPYDLRHWARLIWTRAGLDFASVELLLGHKLPDVTGTYAHLDARHIWPFAVKVSELAGWARPVPEPAPASAPGPAIPVRLLERMTPDALARALLAMPDEELDEVIPRLSPDKVAGAYRAASVAEGVAR